MKNKIRGSFTVEAALIFPIVLFVITAIICLAFYLHDICCIQNIADKALHKASLTLKHDADFASGIVDYKNINERGVFYFLNSIKNEKARIEACLWEEFKGRLLLTEIKNINVSPGMLYVKVTVEGDFHVPFKAVLDYFKPDNMMIKVSSPVHNPAETIRIAQVILDTGSKIKGIDKLKEKLDKIFK